MTFSPTGGLLATANESDNNVSVLSVGPPTAAIQTPAGASHYVVGETVTTSFSCQDALAGPGITRCEDSHGVHDPTGRLDTATVGTHAYSVTATSRDGQQATTTISYTVTTAPDPPPPPGPTPTPDPTTTPDPNSPAMPAPGPGNVLPAATLTITSTAPASGPTSGGQRVTITGANFTDTATVLFDGAPARNVVVERYDRISATTPQHAPGPVAVTVHTTSAMSDPATYTYVNTAQTTSRRRPAPTRCTVPRLYGRTLHGARILLEAAGCRLGRVHRVPTHRGVRVIRQATKPHSRYRRGYHVAVTTGTTRRANRS